MTPGPIPTQALGQKIRLRHTRGRHRDATPAAPVFVQLHELCGNDELSLEGINTEAAMRLLARLVEPASAAIRDQDGQELVQGMPAADRDALLAALHRRCWGDRIVSTLRCTHCAAQFDLSFALSELQRKLYEDGQQWLAGHAAHHAVPVPPTGAQELAAAEFLYGGQPDQARQALSVGADPAALAELLEHAAPILDVDLDAPCAECGHPQQAHFDLQAFVLQRLLDERELLLHEIHTVACGYHWPMHEILSLPRSRRRSFVELLSGTAT
jgi:hypothetical protein